MSLWFILLLLSVLFKSNNSKTKINYNKIISEEYSEIIVTIENVDKDTKSLMKNATTHFQMEIVKLLTEFEIQTAMHRNRTLGEIDNRKWSACKLDHNEKIIEINTDYSKNASLCVNSVQKDVNNKRKSVKTVIREIKDWRKNFNYLINECLKSYPMNIKDAIMCFQDYMKIDNFENIIRRLLIIMETAKQEFTKQIPSSLFDLRNCLEDNFSKFMNNLRDLLSALNECYKEKVRLEDTTIAVEVKKLNTDITKIVCNKCRNKN